MNSREYDEGCLTRAMTNQPITANPYSPGSDEWEEWRYGWLDTDQEEKYYEELEKEKDK